MTDNYTLTSASGTAKLLTTPTLKNHAQSNSEVYTLTKEQLDEIVQNAVRKAVQECKNSDVDYSFLHEDDEDRQARLEQIKKEQHWAELDLTDFHLRKQAYFDNLRRHMTSHQMQDLKERDMSGYYDNL